ncbi:Homeodomain-like protein, partial [Thamnocephalis sphaerospora]
MHSQHRQQPQVGHESWERPKRRRATTHQLTELEQVFQRTFYPTTAERHELARRLGMTPRRVQIWFQNQRQKIAKKEQDERVVR